MVSAGPSFTVTPIFIQTYKCLPGRDTPVHVSAQHSNVKPWTSHVVSSILSHTTFLYLFILFVQPTCGRIAKMIDAYFVVEVHIGNKDTLKYHRNTKKG